jgi:hypothetical protein
VGALENRILDPNVGTMVNPNLEWYKILAPADMFEAKSILTPVANLGNNTSTAGIGEPPIVPTLGAVANAVHNAIGVRVRELPITPDRVLAALSEAKEGLTMNRFELARVTSPSQARELLAAKAGSVFKAGGIDLVDHLKEHLLEPPRVVDLKSIPGLDKIAAERDGSLRIGALATLAKVAGHDAIRKTHPALARACGRPPRRRSATWPRSAATCCSAPGAGTTASSRTSA